MNRNIKAALPLLAAMLLFGCAGSSGTEPAPVSDGQSSGTEQSILTADPSGLPVISIRTQNTGADALDFLTKPVARHVAEAVASWTPGYVIPPEPYYQDCAVTVSGSGGSFTADAAIKARGNWTTKYDKKPMHLKFADKQNLLGLNSGAEMKNWLLLAEYKDASMLRNRTAFRAAEAVLGADGLYTADSALVEVEVNGQYWGVYLLTEQQQVNKNRVSVTVPKQGYTGTDIGYFLEFDGYFYNEDDLHAFHVDYADNAPLVPYDGEGGSGRTIRCLPENRFSRVSDIGFTIKSDINSQEQHDFIADYVSNVYRVLYSAAYEDRAMVFDTGYTQLLETDSCTPEEAVRRAVNIDSLADAYIIAELTCDADIYWSSFFMDVDFGEGGDKRLTFEAPWDFDSGLGNKSRCPDGTGFYACNIVPDVNGNTYETMNPWLVVLMYQDWYREIIREKWTAAYDSGVFGRICEEITADTEKYGAAFARNVERWGISSKDPEFARELCARAKACGTQQAAAEYLREWFEKRVAFMNAQWHK